jgi:hypothetical protein
LEAEHALGAAAAGAPRLATGAEPTRLASFWHVHLLKALRCSGSATHSQPIVHTADERQVECAWAYEQSSVVGGPVLKLFEGEASKAPILRAATGLGNQSCTVSRSIFAVCNSKVLASRQNV